MFVLTLDITDFHDHLTTFHLINTSHSTQSLNKTKIHQLQTWYTLNVTQVAQEGKRKRERKKKKAVTDQRPDTPYSLTGQT